MNAGSTIRCAIVAGEVSGDLHAASLIRALRRQDGRHWRFVGIGGDAMRAAGAELLYHTDEMGVMGAWEVLCRLRLLRRAFRDMLVQLRTDPPDLLLTVDYPGFNLRLAARAKAMGIPTVHYISPKVWAWNRRRIPRMARALDLLLTVFPFEAACFRDTDLNVAFVGHPLVDRVRETREAPPAELPWAAGHRLALLPGSRTGEITRLLPDMLATAACLEAEAGPLACLIPAPTAAAAGLAQQIVSQCPRKPAGTRVVSGQARQVLLQARATLAASGTATLEACLLCCPTVIVYRVAWPTYLLGKLLIRGVRHIGLANIVAGETICPELIQTRFTPRAAAAKLAPLLGESPERQQMIEAMTAVNRALDTGHADQTAAAAILDFLHSRNPEPEPPAPKGSP